MRQGCDLRLHLDDIGDAPYCLHFPSLREAVCGVVDDDTTVCEVGSDDDDGGGSEGNGNPIHNKDSSTTNSTSSMEYSNSGMASPNRSTNYTKARPQRPTSQTSM